MSCNCDDKYFRLILILASRVWQSLAVLPHHWKLKSVSKHLKEKSPVQICPDYGRIERGISTATSVKIIDIDTTDIN